MKSRRCHAPAAFFRTAPFSEQPRDFAIPGQCDGLGGRHAGQAPEIDGSVYLSHGEARPGEMRRVRITHASDWDLVGDLQCDAPPTPKRRVGLKLLPESPERRWQ